MSEPAVSPLFVRVFYVDSTLPFQEFPVPDMETGIDVARDHAGSRQVRAAAVMDQFMTVWAQFNMLWSWPNGAV